MRREALVLIAFVGLGVGALLSVPGLQPFPHEKHAGLFPTCVGCHAGIESGDEAAVYSVEPSLCATCHDGSMAPVVEWQEPVRQATNLTFSHTRHPELECTVCHQESGAEARMQVVRARPDTCLGCHAPEAERHEDAGFVPCAQCHVPLADATGLTEGQIAAFPQPSDHADSDFLFVHGEGARADVARCSVCHVRDSCTRCHLNASSVVPIAALASDPRVAALVEGRAGEWPTPPSHEASGWALTHGVEASGALESCANCHARPSCETCHGVGNPLVADLPEPQADGPTGVSVTVVRPPGHTPDFIVQHREAAAEGLPRCSSCHTESECVECHQMTIAGQAPEPATDEFLRRFGALAPATPAAQPAGGYHPVDFVLRHGAEAYAARSSCGECHSTEVFCRTCHTNSGFGDGRDSRGNAFHNAQPDWLLSHGKAARQGMEECASCHQQTSCLRCHSAKAGLRINPHGPGFDPERVADRSTMSCGICHTSDIVNP
ncbi:MAG: hypothetical protein KAJ67_05400 [Gemmatimonadetes bacterium]|nr:hypothetical protein [Gemmatimonadota bacterium]